MGIIIRQSLKGSIVNFVGIGIAAVSVLFIYPQYSELYGLAQFLISTAALMIPFASLGILGSLTKFFPTFKTDNHTNNGFLGVTFISLAVLFSIFSIFYLGFSTEINSWLNSYSDGRAPLNTSLLHVILILCLLSILNYIYSNYAANYQRIVIPQIITLLSLRIFLPIVIILSSYYNVSFVVFGYLLIAFAALQLIAQHIYLLKLGILKIRKPNWEFLTGDLRKKIINYKLFATFNHLGYVLAFRIDMFMIPIFMDYTSNGIYAIMLFISNVIEIPARAVIGIAEPIISRAWTEGNMNEINTIYKKSTLNLLIPGIAIFALIWFGFDEMTTLSTDPEKLLIGKYALLFLGIGKLIDLLTSVNNQIIIYSPKYKYNLIFILLLGLVNVVLNYQLIQDYGIAGAAFASFMAYLMYNITKLIFIYYHFKIHPFTKEVGILIPLGLAVMGILWIIPNTSYSLVSLAINALVIAIIYFPVIYFLKLSEDLNSLIDLGLAKAKSILNLK